MNVVVTKTKSILTPQTGGFLAAGPYPFTHALSAYTGCGFGMTTCGQYCYAQFLPNWTFSSAGARWGTLVRVKENAAALLERSLRAMRAETRRKLRIFMSATTDPYQPIESQYGLTRRCLEVFARYDDLDLLVIQTRAPLASRDFDVMRSIPYAWLSITIETDDQAELRRSGGGPALAKRLGLATAARQADINTQVTISPCLPHTTGFATTLLATGVRRFVVDTFVDGDGTEGSRTARSPYARQHPEWRDETLARRLFETLGAAGGEVGWSTEGFCGIPPRQAMLAH